MVTLQISLENYQGEQVTVSAYRLANWVANSGDSRTLQVIREVLNTPDNYPEQDLTDYVRDTFKNARHQAEFYLTPPRATPTNPHKETQ